MGRQKKQLLEEQFIEFLEESIEGITLALIKDTRISSQEVLIERMRKFYRMKEYMEKRLKEEWGR